MSLYWLWPLGTRNHVKSFKKFCKNSQLFTHSLKLDSHLIDCESVKKTKSFVNAFNRPTIDWYINWDMIKHCRLHHQSILDRMRLLDWHFNQSRSIKFCKNSILQNIKKLQNSFLLLKSTIITKHQSWVAKNFEFWSWVQNHFKICNIKQFQNLTPSKKKKNGKIGSHHQSLGIKVLLLTNVHFIYFCRELRSGFMDLIMSGELFIPY